MLSTENAVFEEKKLLLVFVNKCDLWVILLYEPKLNRRGRRSVAT